MKYITFHISDYWVLIKWSHPPLKQSKMAASLEIVSSHLLRQRQAPLMAVELVHAQVEGGRLVSQQSHLGTLPMGNDIRQYLYFIMAIKLCHFLIELPSVGNCSELPLPFPQLELLSISNNLVSLTLSIACILYTYMSFIHIYIMSVYASYSYPIMYCMTLTRFSSL